MSLSPEQLMKLRRSRTAARLRLARELSGLTQQVVADAVGLSQSALSDLERQRYAATTVDTARKLAGFYGCLIEDICPARQAVAS